MVKKMFEKRWIKPDRIIWCYGQWQDAYRPLSKWVEFVKGIPDDLEKDDYLDVTKKNVIVLDDLMSRAKSDIRVADLFSRGSHHRNLSVVYLTQNLYPQGKASRDIALNCHYLLLFKNPIDQSQILALARRMYPGQAEKFMHAYSKATALPYGSLLIDCRSTTSDDQRLLPLPPEQVYKNDGIKRTYHRAMDPDTWASCDACGTVFDNHHDLQRHVKSWCPEGKPQGRGETIGPPGVRQNETTDEQPPIKWRRLYDSDEGEG
ncbi:MAG: hypothetical protein MJA29_02735 [Candidatus Omnitrophica bacterium]|nr:hypothetical protein [Candidatus Omnitrophota bacterium]